MKILEKLTKQNLVQEENTFWMVNESEDHLISISSISKRGGPLFTIWTNGAILFSTPNISSLKRKVKALTEKWGLEECTEDLEPIVE